MKFHRSAPRKLKNGRTVYYIRYWDGTKHKTLSRSLYTPFDSEKKADDWIGSEEAKKALYLMLEPDQKLKAQIPIEKIEKSLKDLEWKTRFFNQNEDFKDYIEEMKKPDGAPNSWQATRAYLEYYVFHFFLGEKQEGNYILWHRHFYEFVEWLRDKAISKKTGKRLSYSTKNACIKTLNSFLRFICFKKFSNREPLLLIKCPSFANHLLKENQRTYKDIILEGELNIILTKLNQKNEAGEVSKTVEFLTILYNSGMRFKELYTMTLDCVIDKPDKLPSFMTEVYRNVGKPIYGYLLLKSQSLHKVREESRVTEKMRKNKNLNISQEVGTLLRKALKSKKTISPKHNRLIPIWDQTTWEIIKRNQAVAAKKYLNKLHGPETKREDYYLLDDIEENHLRSDMRDVSTKSFHATRHSFITLNTGFLISKNIVPEPVMRSITGITSKVLENYTHTYEELMLSVAGWNDDNEELG